MSARSDLARAFATSFSNVIDSSEAALKAYTNSQYNRIDAQVTDDYNAFMSELQYDNDFDSYEQKVSDFWAQEDEKIQNGGYGALAPSMYMEKRRQSLEDQMRTSAKDMMVEGCWRQAKTNYDTKCNFILANDELTYDQKKEAIQTEYDSCLMSQFPVKMGSVKTPEEYLPTIKATSIQQAFSERFVSQYADSYFYEGASLEGIFDKMKESSGISDWTEEDKATAMAYIEKSLSGIYSQKGTEATHAQNAIVSDFSTKYLNGEDYTAEDVIVAAVNAGALRADGTVDMHWAKFLNPYIEAAEKQRIIDEETARIADEGIIVDNLTADDVIGIAGQVSNGTFNFSPITAKDVDGNVAVSGNKINLPDRVKYGSPVVSNGTHTGTGLQVNETVRITPEGDVTSNGEDVGATVFESDNGSVYILSDNEISGLDSNLLVSPEEKKQMMTPARERAMGLNSGISSVGNTQYIYKVGERDEVFIEDYAGHEGSDRQELSDVASSLVDMTEGTEFSNAFSTDGSINYNNSMGKYTYKFNGLPDVECQYAPIVMALCQEYGIEYDTDSYSVYKLAEYVQNLADAGAFTDPNKASAVQMLANKRLNPGVTPEEYNAMVMETKASGILTDKEIEEYGLAKSAFAGDLNGTSYNDAMNLAYRLAFQNLYNKTYSSSEEGKLNADKYNQWFSMKQDLEKELILRYQTDPSKTTSNPLGAVQEVVEKLTDKKFSEELYDTLLSVRPSAGSLTIGFGGSVTTNERPMLGDNSTVTGLLSNYFATGRYADYLDSDIVSYVGNNFYNPTDVSSSSIKVNNRATTRKQINEVAQEKYQTDYKDLSIGQKNTVLFSYMYAKTQNDLSRTVCYTFGYGMDEIYGNVTVAASDEMGGGMAVVTRDGRVYMAGASPDGQGHSWMLGSVSERTLNNIKKGATTVSYAEVSANGVQYFRDGNHRYDSSGAILAGKETTINLLGMIPLFSVKNKGIIEKEHELVGLYQSIQPERYNIKNLNQGIRE